MAYQPNPPHTYDGVSTAIRRLRAEGCAMLPEQLAIYRHLAQRLRGQRLLDVGCGIGIGTNVLTHWGCRVVGVDMEPANVAFAQAMFPEIRFFVWDIMAGPVLCDAPLDAVVAVEVIEHVEEAARAVRHLRASGRTLYVSTPNRACPLLGQTRPLNPLHVREFTPVEMQELVGERLVIRDPFSWREVGADSLMTPLVYEVAG